MALADTARLAVDLSLKGNFASSLKANQKALTGFDSAVSRTGSRATKAGQQVGTGIRNGAILAAGGITFLVSQVGFGLRSLADLESKTLQTNAVLKSTKGVAGQTAASIRDLAMKYENLNATIDDKVIQSAENVLLTFTNIRKDAFEPTLAAALDLSTAMGQDLQTSIVQVGKALNDPAKGLTALQRIGVSFTKDQVKQIKALNDSGKAMEAQKIILAELNKEFGGSFAAAGKGAEGTIAGIGDAVEDLQKTLATGLFPVISKLLPKIRAALADPKVLATVQKLGDAIAGLFTDANIAEGGKILGSLFETAKAAAPVVGEAAKATLGAVKAAVSLFTSLPKEVQQLAVGAFAINKITGGLVTNVGGAIAGGIAEAVLKKFAGVVNVNGAVVNVVGAGGIPGGPSAGPAAGGVGNAVRTAATGVAVVVTPIAAAVGAQAVLNATIPNMGVAQSALERATARAEAERADAENGTAAAIKALASATEQSATAQVRAIDRAESIASAKSDDQRAAANRAVAAIKQVESTENRTANALAAKLAGVRSAQQAAAFAIRDKDLSVKVNNTVNVNASFSVADVTRGTVRLRRYGNVSFANARAI